MQRERISPTRIENGAKIKDAFERLMTQIGQGKRTVASMEVFPCLLDALQKNGIDVLAPAKPDGIPAVSPSQVAETIRKNIGKFNKILEGKQTLLEKSDALRGMGIRGSCISLAIAKFLS